MNEHDTESLRRAYGTGQGSLADDQMPSAEELVAAAAGELDPERIAELARLAATSPELAEEWRMARALQGRGKLVRLRPSRLWPAVLAAAAVLVMAVAVSILWQPGAPVLRGPGSPIGSLLATDAALPRDHFVLRWNPVDGVASYELRVTNPELQLLLEVTDLDSSQHQVPPSALTSIADGDLILWQVVATLDSGERLVSATFTQRIDGSPGP